MNELIAANGFSSEIDLFSLDVDGNDYWIWKALAVRPRVVVAEYNSFFGPDLSVTIPFQREFWRPDLTGPARLYHGASLAALTGLASSLGCRLVATDPSGSNAVFLRQDVAAETLPAQSVRAAFRFSRKHALARIEHGGAVEQLFAGLQLPLEHVAPIGNSS